LAGLLGTIFKKVQPGLGFLGAFYGFKKITDSEDFFFYKGDNV